MRFADFLILKVYFWKVLMLVVSGTFTEFCYAGEIVAGYRGPGYLWRESE